MRGAFVLANEENLFADIVATLLPLGAEVADDNVVQSSSFGSIVTIFGHLNSEFERDLSTPPVATHGSIEGVDLEHMTACWVECNSFVDFAKFVAVIAGARAETTWVLDSDGVLWATDSIEPEKLVL